MIKKPITYKDFDGKTVTENFYFNFTKAEIMSILAKDENVIERFRRAKELDTPASYIEPFEWILSQSFGIRKDNLFLKTEESAKAFLTSEPYSELFTELLTDSSKAIEFFNGVFPKELIDQALEDLDVAKTNVPEAAEVLNKEPELRDVESYTVKELMEMDEVSFKKLRPAGNNQPKNYIIASYQRDNK